MAAAGRASAGFPATGGASRLTTGGAAGRGTGFSVTAWRVIGGITTGTWTAAAGRPLATEALGTGDGCDDRAGADGRTGPPPARFLARRRAVASNASKVPGRGGRGTKPTGWEVAGRARSAPAASSWSRTRARCPAMSRPRWSNWMNVAPSRPSRTRRESPVSTPDGPTSTNVRTPSAHSFSTTSTHRTVWVICRTRLCRTSSTVTIGAAVVLL